MKILKFSLPTCRPCVTLSEQMEELDLYKHIEGVKNSKYLDVFNTLIENLETRRKRNFHLKKVDWSH